jgi:hypothetical protein
VTWITVKTGSKYQNVTNIDLTFTNSSNKVVDNIEYTQISVLYNNKVSFIHLNTVAQLVEALHYKPEDRGLDFRWCHWKFFLNTWSFRPHYGPGVNLASNRNEYQKNFLGGKDSRCVGLTNLPSSRVNSLEVLEALKTPGILRACLYRHCFTHT